MDELEMPRDLSRRAFQSDDRIGVVIGAGALGAVEVD